MASPSDPWARTAALWVLSNELAAVDAEVAAARAELVAARPHLAAADTRAVAMRRSRAQRTRARSLRWIGRTTVAAAVVLALGALRGTDAHAQHAASQQLLRAEFGRALEGHRVRPVSSPATEAPAALPTDALARLEIPAIDVHQIVVEGISPGTLGRGPGHYPGTALPGQSGNFAVAGHRTTHGAPFAHLDELEPGDEIVVTTVEGRFVYRVTEERIVAPTAVGVLSDFGDDRITLTTCHPADSSRQRLVVVATRA